MLVFDDGGPGAAYQGIAARAGWVSWEFTRLVRRLIPTRWANPMLQFQKRWNMEWNGHQVVVTNGWDLLLRTREVLVIDGQVADVARGWGNVSRELVGQVESDDGTSAVRAHIGGIYGGFSVGCQLFIDNELVGGDIDKTFVS